MSREARPKSSELWIMISFVILACAVIALGLSFSGGAPVAVFGYHGTLILGLLFWARRRGPVLGEVRDLLGGIPPARVWILASFLIVSSGAAVLAMERYVRAELAPDLDHVDRTLRDWGIPVVSKAFAGIYAPIVNPLLEEFFWRGAVLTCLSERYGATRGILGMSLLFTSYHAIPLAHLFPLGIALLVLSLVFVGGVLFGFLARWSRGLWIPIFAHVSANVAVAIVRSRVMG